MSFDPRGVTYGPGVVQFEGVVEYAGDPSPRVIHATVREVAIASDTTNAPGPPVSEPMITQGGDIMITQDGDDMETQ